MNHFKALHPVGMPKHHQKTLHANCPLDRKSIHWESNFVFVIRVDCAKPEEMLLLLCGTWIHGGRGNP